MMFRYIANCVKKTWEKAANNTRLIGSIIREPNIDITTPKMISTTEKILANPLTFPLFRWNPFSSSLRDLTPNLNEFEPPCEFVETNYSYIMTVDLPGIDKKDIHCEVLKNGELLIEAKRERKYKKETEVFVQSGTSYGVFRQMLSLPHDANIDSIKANYERGVLHINITKLTNETNKTMKKNIHIE